MKTTDNQKKQTDKKAPDKKKEPLKKDKKNQSQGLTQEDLPDSTNTSTGQVGSGLRQDSN
ncbi:hypothetical protein QTN47_19265 [Danxiaibacter flavus]|uniref:Uncharacterized protein n=1 Tax=Danxiaibacter flavus TaxID=3049108 RepID=A0ABV3ZIL6_9BACT|nr:hypothetical protein QNM32_19275 [Chitinophagaceae bacterium DXS]